MGASWHGAVRSVGCLRGRGGPLREEENRSREEGCELAPRWACDGWGAARRRQGLDQDKERAREG